MPSIWYQSFVHPVEQEPYLRRLQSLLDGIASPDVRFEVHGLDPPDHLFHPLTELRCGIQAIRNALEAERAKYDAFVIGHFQEPGLLEITRAVAGMSQAGREALESFFRLGGDPQTVVASWETDGRLSLESDKLGHALEVVSYFMADPTGINRESEPN